MPMFFTLDRVKQACSHLFEYKSQWVICPLVFAVNGVNSNSPLEISRGTNTFLNNYFSGKLVGLESIDYKTMTPVFRDQAKKIAGDSIVLQKQALWGSKMSSRGYREMAQQEYLEMPTPSVFKLNQSFQGKFETELDGGFHFEELLIWLYAFEGIPDGIGNWNDLYVHFQEKYLGISGRFQPEYIGRFHVNNGVDWPNSFLNERPSNSEYLQALIPSKEFSIKTGLTMVDMTNEFVSDLLTAGLVYNDNLIKRYISSLLAKKFLILTGLAGSGKTKLAQSFAKWICKDTKQFAIVPVGPDWTNNENVLGYADAFDKNRYIVPACLELVLRATENKGEPHFLILDEMNLSHVERYFADILSALESSEKIKLHSDESRGGVPGELVLPSNLFIIGTVNVDETTYMFSPKVLDRANVIEFKMSMDEVERYLDDPQNIRLEELECKGAFYGVDFVSFAKDQHQLGTSEMAYVKEEILMFFDAMSKYGFEFGYRTIKEVLRFIYFYDMISNEELSIERAIDAQILQKFLPKIHGSRKKIEALLWGLATLCFENRLWDEQIEETHHIGEEIDHAALMNGTHEGVSMSETNGEKLTEDSGETTLAVTLMRLSNKDSILKSVRDSMRFGTDYEPSKRPQNEASYPMSFRKLVRMIDQLQNNGFVSYTEA